MEKLFKLQNEIGALVKNQDNPYFKSKYFDVNQIIEHLKPLFEKHGLVVLQPLSNIDGKMALLTEVYDKETGSRLAKSEVPLPEAPDAQKYGSAITYFRRYALQSLFLLQAQDDDGNQASEKSVQLGEKLPKVNLAVSKKSQEDYNNGVDPLA